MTKVKTILAEFCSAKDILAINRLGLLNKKEERETQPIPWRHRLPNSERREMVRSEMRMNLRPTSHTTNRDKTKALTTARCPKDSKMGEFLINSHVRCNTPQSAEKITTHQRRTESQLSHVKRNFIQKSQCLNHEPLILVERPTSPHVKARAQFMEKHGIDPIVVHQPNYMRPTLSRSRLPSTITTIEAFTLETKKKHNLWDEAIDDKEPATFKSIAKPCARLNEHELSQLKVGHEIHKPTVESVTNAQPSPNKIRHRRTKRPKTTGAKIGKTFLTELPKKFQLGSKFKGNRKYKSVNFNLESESDDDLCLTDIFSKQNSSNRPPPKTEPKPVYEFKKSKSTSSLLKNNQQKSFLGLVLES